MWTQVAVALVFELGIYRAGSRDKRQYSAKVNFPLDPSADPIRSMEERRAILGVFIVSSMQVVFKPSTTRHPANHAWHRVWTNLRQMEALRWTPYMDDCVRILREERETKLDLLLTLQAKCHVVVEQITHSPFEWGLSDEMTRPTAAYFVKALQLQLQDIRQSVPAEIRSDRQSHDLPECIVELS